VKTSTPFTRAALGVHATPAPLRCKMASHDDGAQVTSRGNERCTAGCMRRQQAADGGGCRAETLEVFRAHGFVRELPWTGADADRRKRPTGGAHHRHGNDLDTVIDLAAHHGPALAPHRADFALQGGRRTDGLTSGEVIDRSWTRFAFSPTWQYDVLRGLDYLGRAGVEPDQRIAEAIGMVQQRRHQNGRWPLNVRHHDRIPFGMEPGVGTASRWNTPETTRGRSEEADPRNP
jgi:hypothetical protein